MVSTTVTIIMVPKTILRLKNLLEGLTKLTKNHYTYGYGLLQVKGYRLKQQRRRVNKADQDGKVTVFYYLPSKEHQFRQSPMGETAFVKVQLSRGEVLALTLDGEKSLRLDAMKKIKGMISCYPHHPSHKAAQLCAERNLPGL